MNACPKGLFNIFHRVFNIINLVIHDIYVN